MPAPPLELDNRWFEVLATSDRAVLTRHRISGSLTVWKLDWLDHGDFPDTSSSEAWAQWMRLSNEH
jgi:hypothetical protein